MWIVVPTYRGTLNAMEFRDDATVQQIEAIIPGNWFGSSKKTKEDAIDEARAAGLKYVDHEKMKSLRERCESLRDQCRASFSGKDFISTLPVKHGQDLTPEEVEKIAVAVRRALSIPVPPETYPEDADP